MRTPINKIGCINHCQDLLDALHSMLLVVLETVALCRRVYCQKGAMRDAGGEVMKEL